MPELKRNFDQGRMNKDIDERMVPKGEYRDALNIEVSTSEGSNVGTIQTLKGNTLLTNDLFNNTATCVGSISNESTNKLYWLVSDPGKNVDASTTQAIFANQSGVNTPITHDVYSDYIMEYDEVEGLKTYVVVEHYKVVTTISNNAHSNSNHLHISNLGTANDIRLVGIQVGMDVTINGMRTSIIKIEADTGTWNGWRVYTEHTESDSGFEALEDVVSGDTVTFELPYNKRALGFSWFADQKPKKVITGINIIDDLLFWTDGLTEPKKINIKRCIYGSQQLDPTAHPTGTRTLPTLLVVNGESPSYANGRLGNIALYPSAIEYPFLSYKQTTVIKKSPIDPLILTMSNTTRPDQQPQDGLVILSTTITVTDNFFFNTAGERLGNGAPTGTSLTFNPGMDWEEGDTIEWFTEDDNDIGFDNEPIATLIVQSISNGGTVFTFTIQSISNLLIKPYLNFKVRLQQEEDPLFEFKFPRFAYRWKYEDGEYSCYSPFSDVAFLPEEFDYLPKKGYNLGMTNNLRYLVLSGFKPKTMPIDVVEIDILYKESNSPNIYTVDTIKAPSQPVDYLGSDNYSINNANAWFGKIKHGTSFREIPTTLETSPQLVGVSALTGGNTGDFYTLEDRFNTINIKVGDIITLGNIGNIGSGTLRISGMQNTVIQVPLALSTSTIDLTVSQVSISSTDAAGVVTNVTTSPTPTWLTSGNTVTFNRNIAPKPAVYVGDPVGSLHIKSDMIYATVPSNQLLRPYDNVPRSALAQEVTGNRVVYGNYVQNYDLVDLNNELTRVSFKTGLHGRSNVRESVRYNDRTALVNQTDGSTLNWWDPANRIALVKSKPERSLKSLRDYQIGVAYIDEFGRQTPVQTHENAVRRIPKSYANKYNSLRVQLDPEYSTFPKWATHFKFYIKENANEYYNLAMDRFYSAEDGNIWLSFPSSERNKVDEETFLILKKQHDNDEFVFEKARYKILAIENEAPLFVKTKMDSFGIVTPTFPNNDTSGFPKIGEQFTDIDKGLFSNTSLTASSDASNERVMRVSNATNVSRWYDIVSITDVNSYRRITVSKPFGVDVAFTTSDNTNTGSYVGSVSIEIAKKEVKNLPEFSGRFFVKIYKDGTFLKNITAMAPDRNFVVTNTIKLGRRKADSDKTTERNFWKGNGNYEGIPPRKWFVDECSAEGVHPDDNMGLVGNFHLGKGIHGNNKIDLAYTSFDGESGFDFGDTPSPWHIKISDDENVSEADKRVASTLKTSGTLFRWKGDTTVYKIMHTENRSIENYTQRSNLQLNYLYNSEVNHREKFRIEFEPELGVTGLIDAVGKPTSGFNPLTESAPGVINNWWSEWSRLGSDQTPDKHRTIEILEEFAADESYTSDNPAIWETEPKENVDVDLYNEASAALPIKKEFDTYKNEIYSSAKYTSTNALSYYNCFSFNNGVESNRIRDDYNTVTIDKGPKVSTVLAEQYKEEHRKSGLIYSGIFNSTSGINSLNQFIQAEKITKDINPAYGSIQKLHAGWGQNGSLIALCEDRVLNILADKDALFNADGDTNVTSTNKVLGSASPYSAENGISTDPESFAFDQYRCYFTDKSRGAVVRLSRDGLTSISDHGMRDYFKDVLKTSNLSLIGSYDDNKKLYNLTMREGPNNLFKPAIDVEVTAGDGLDFIDYADTNIIGYIPFDSGGHPGVHGDSTGPFANGSAPPYSYGVIGNASTTFGNANGGAVQAFGLYNVSNTSSTGGQSGVNAVTQFHLPVMDWYSTAITSRMSALIDVLNSCPNGNVYLHAQIQASGEQGNGESPSTYVNTGFPIVTYKVNSINNTGTRFELNVSYFSGLHGGNIDSYYFWYSTEGCDIELGGDPSLQAALSSSKLGFVEITASFSEDTKGWTSFKSWLQESGISLNDNYFTFNEAELYHHHSNETRNSFYGTEYDSFVCAIFNDAPSSVKNFGSLSYEGSQSRVVANTTDGEYYNQVDVNGWYAEYISTDLETGFVPEFKNKEGKWFNYIKGNQENTLSNLNVKQFSTQGIGTPSNVSTNGAAAVESFTLTIKDTGDTD